MRTGKHRSTMLIISRGWPGMLEVPSLFLYRLHDGSTVSSHWGRATDRIGWDYVWTRPALLRCQRDQARVLDSAASADSEFSAELECGPDRLAPRGPV